MVKNLKLLDKALQLLPEVKETVVEPLDIAAFLKPLKKGDSVEIDFGRHLVGHIKLKFGVCSFTSGCSGMASFLVCRK